MPQYIFVDTENVNKHLENLFDILKKNAKVTMVYTDATNTMGMSFETLNRFTDKNAEVIPLWCKNGQHDALDIFLAGQLGYTICKTSMTYKTPCEYIIYSDDKGYDAFVHIFRQRGFNIRRVESGLSELSNPPKNSKTKKKDETKSTAPPVITNLREHIPSDLETASEGVKQVCIEQYMTHLGSAGCKLKEQEIIAQIILESHAKKKNEQFAYIYNQMRARIGNEKTKELYTKLKKVIKGIITNCQRP